MTAAVSTAQAPFAVVERIKRDQVTIGLAFYLENGDLVNLSQQQFEFIIEDGGVELLKKVDGNMTRPAINRLVITLTDGDKALLVKSRYSYVLYNTTKKRTELTGVFSWAKTNTSVVGVIDAPDIKIVYTTAGSIEVRGLIIQGEQGPAGEPFVNWQGEWLPNTLYELGDGVSQGGNSYRRKGTGLSPAAFDVTNWDVVAVGGVPANGTVTPEKTTFASHFGADGSFYISDATGSIGLILLPNGTLRVHKLESIMNLLINGVEFDLSSMIKSSNPDWSFLKTNFHALSGSNDLVITDPNGFVGWKLSADGLMSVVKAAVSKLIIGGSITTEHPDYLLAAADSNTAIGFAITKFSELLIRAITAQVVTVKTLNVTESVNFPPSFSLADKTPFAFGKPSDYFHTISYGQSNSLGGGNVAAVTTVQKFDALQPKGGRSVATGGDVSDLVPFVDTITESPLGGLFEEFTQLLIDQNFLASSGKGFQLVATTPGAGSTDIAGLSKGTVPYVRLIDNVTQLKALAAARNKSYTVGFIPWTQGEQDVANNTTYAAYLAATKQLITDLNTDIRALTGQKSLIPLISYQVSWGADVDRIAKVHLDLGLSHPLFVLACPSYHFDYEPAGLIHFTPAHRRLYGAYLAVAAKKTLVDGVKFLPLHPIQFLVTGNNLQITYHVPKPPLVFDTALVPDPGQYGFKVYSSTGAVLTLTNIRIVSKDTISIDCSASPAGGTFAYAKSLTSSNFIAGDGTTGKLGNRGCLRDSAGITQVFDNYPLHNWAVASYQSIS